MFQIFRTIGLSLLLVFSSVANVLAVPLPHNELWVANGPIHAMASNDDVSHLFVNGVFNYTAPGTGAMALDASSGSFDSGFPHINGPVYALVSDAAGGWYVGGNFTQVGGLARNYLAYISWDSGSSVWTVEDWDAGANAAVHALTLSSDGLTLYVGGEFTTLNGGGLTRNYLAALETGMVATVSAWDPDLNDTVRTLQLSIDGKVLYVGGDFTSAGAGATSRNFALAIDTDVASPDYGKPTTWDPDANGAVYTMALVSGEMYLGGGFTELGGGSVNRQYAAAVSLSNAAVDSGWNPSPNDRVRVIVVSDSRVYLGGDFTTLNFNTVSQSYLAAVDTGNGVVDSGWNPGVDAAVYSLLASPGGILFAGGEFTRIDGQQRNRLASLGLISGELNDWSPDAWATVQALGGFGSVLISGGGFDRDGRSLLYIGGSFDYVGPVTGGGVSLDSAAQVDVSLPQVDGIVYAVVADGAGGWYIGGEFSSVGGVARNNLAHIDGAGVLDATWDADPNGLVRALAVDGTYLYAGGDFTRVAGGAVTRNYLAAFDPANGAVVGGWDADPNGVVRALAVDGTYLYAGGDFTRVAGGAVTRNYLAAFDPAGGAVRAGWQLDANGAVYVLGVAGTRLYVGGDFTLLGDVSRNRIATASTANATVDAWNPSAGDIVYALAEQGGEIFIGGSFVSVGGKTRRNLAALEVYSGRATAWNPGVNGEVRAIELSGINIYIGGNFSVAGGRYRNNLALLDKDTGVAAAWNPDADGPVYCISPSGNNVTVLLAGAFNQMGGLERHGLAEVDVNGLTTYWDPALDTGAEVRDILLAESVLYVGGVFTSTDASNGAVLVSDIAALNRTSGGLLEWRPVVDGAVNTLLLSADQSRLYIGGEFTVVDSVSRLHIAALDPQASIDGSYVLAWVADTGSFSDTVLALAMSQDRTTLYAGGEFSLLAGVSRDRLAAIRVGDAAVIDDGSWTVGADNTISGLLFSDEVLFVAGSFNFMGQQLRPGLAALSALSAEANPPQTQASLAGGNYNKETLVPVELLCDDGLGSGCATTYYAINNGPWLLYSSPLQLKENADLRFFSVDYAGNYEDITVNNEHYVLEIVAPETTISPATSVYQSERLTVSMTCSDDVSGCAATYYTLDNSTPTLSSQRYTGPFVIHGNVVVKYFSVDQVGNQEVIRRASYVSAFGGGGVWDVVLLTLILVNIVRAFGVNSLCFDWSCRHV